MQRTNHVGEYPIKPYFDLIIVNCRKVVASLDFISAGFDEKTLN